MNKDLLTEKLKSTFGEKLQSIYTKDVVIIEVDKNNLIDVCKILRDDSELHYEVLLDVLGVDYLKYGVSQWRTEETTGSGFSRGKAFDDEGVRVIDWDKPRFGVVYQLLSIKHNHRLRIKVFLEGTEPMLPSIIDVWPSANWYEREAFDLFGIIFEGHPDLRRLLTDYGFKGHPFRKDFPLIGEVEMRYDAAQQRCVYEPVSIQERVMVPKVIRKDNRYV